MPLDGWSTVEVAGRDRASFLHNLCTNDVRGLAPGAGCEAFFTDVKGKIVAHAFVLVGDEAIQLVMVPGSAALLIAHLERYVIREDVQLSDLTATVSWSLVVGFNAAERLVELARDVPGVDRLVADDAAPWSHAVVPLGRLNRIAARVVRCPLPWCGGYLLGCGGNHAAKVREKLIGCVECPPPVWQALRVESAWPLWGVDFDHANLPQEVGRDAVAISFRKGCYLGQETVARIDALGHVNKRLVQVRLTGGVAPPVGAELRRSGASVGRVTSSCWSPAFNAPLALAMVERRSNDPGTAVECGDETGEVVVESLAEFVRHGLLPGNAFRTVQYNFWSEPWTRIR